MRYIEDRPLNRLEVQELINDAPETETRNLKTFLREFNLDAYSFLHKHSVYRYGLIVNGRPVYFVYISNLNGKYESWSVVNSNIKDQIALFKHSKKNLKEALKQFSPIYATMEKSSPKNIEWTKRLGFKEVSQDECTITLEIRS